MGRPMMRMRLARIAERQAHQMEAHKRLRWERFREIVMRGRPETWEAMNYIAAAREKYGDGTPEMLEAAKPWMEVIEQARVRLGLEW